MWKVGPMQSLPELNREQQYEQSPLSVLDFPSPQPADSPDVPTHSQPATYPAWGHSWGPCQAALAGEIFAQSQAVAAAGQLSASLSTPAKGQRHSSSYLAYNTSPSRDQKSRAKIRRLRTFSRSSSLSDDKVLLQSKLVRSQSSFRLLDHFVLEEQIGRSELSEVFKARHKGTGELYAVKRSTRRFASKAHRDKCMHEMAAVSCLPEHPNVVAYFRAWQQHKHFYIQMALCEGGSLAQHLRGVEQIGERLPEHRIWQVLSDLAQGLEFLHNHNILHLDIKPDNIFLDAQGRCKIGDFGLAIKEHETEWEEGDGDYLAPELLSSEEPTFAADVYSAGATIYECCTGERLAESRGNLEHKDLHVSRELTCLVLRMLDSEPAARPTASAINLEISQHQGPPQAADTSMERVASLCHGLPATPAQNQGRPVADAAITQFAGLPVPTSEPSTPDLFAARPVVTPAVHIPSGLRRPVFASAYDSSFAATPSLHPPKLATAETPRHFTQPPMSPFALCDVPETQLPASPRPLHPNKHAACRNAGVEDTAHRVAWQPSRNHWSRKGIQFPPHDHSPPVPASPVRFGTSDPQSPSMARKPADAGGRLFTALRSPFGEAACQDSAAEKSNASNLGSESSPSWRARASPNSVQSTDNSYTGSEEFQSTVRMLSMSIAKLEYNSCDAVSALGACIHTQTSF